MKKSKDFMGSVSMMHGKLHMVKITEARKDYEGSITIDRDLVEAAGMTDHQYVVITNRTNKGKFWETYVMYGKAGSGEICANGSAAWHFRPGDKVIIIARTDVPYAKRLSVRPRSVLVNEKNQVKEIRTYNLKNHTFTSERFTPKPK
ncbi:MAG: aspartate 1-decarboxylase [Patescibacteria group bacterium]|nr:aspartate 1-decarboxylase [Patescibacteria group bacterium]